MNKQTYQNYKDYYENFKRMLLPTTKNREHVFLKPKTEHHTFEARRLMRNHNFKSLEWAFLTSKIFENRQPMNLYVSIAYYKNGVPIIKNGQKFKEENQKIKENWNKTHKQQIINFPLFIDVDSPSHDKKDMDEAKIQTLKIANDIKELTKEEPYIQFSGMGYHILQFRQIKDSDDINDHLEQDYMLAKYYQELGYNFVDTNIYDSKRVIKQPFSLSIYDEELYITLPISLNELEHFDFKTAEYNGRESKFEHISQTYLSENAPKEYKTLLKKWQNENEYIENKKNTSDS